MKTAMHYSINRGWCVIDDTEAVRALQADAEGDFQNIVVEAEDKTRTESLTDRLLTKSEPTLAESGFSFADFEAKLAACKTTGEINAVFKALDVSKLTSEETERINVLGLEREQAIGAIQD